jgi:hypothetical protein
MVITGDSESDLFRSTCLMFNHHCVLEPKSVSQNCDVTMVFGGYSAMTSIKGHSKVILATFSILFVLGDPEQ